MKVVAFIPDDGYPHCMLPQTLILTDGNVVARRINGSVGDRNTLPIEDAIDAAQDVKGG